MTADLTREPLTRSAEDYLKAIYRLSLEGPATTSHIAQALDLAPPSVTGMVKRLSEQGLLEHEPYKGVVLTAEGRRVALRMVRRHRLIEAYLVAFLGYAWDTVHEEAERLEHAVSDGLVERMAAALGNPGFDPHGDPIPAPDGSMAEVVYTSLTDIPPDQPVVIRRVNTSQPDQLRYIASFDLKPGTEVRVVKREPFRGPITIRIGAKHQVLGHDIAGLLLCAPTENTRS